MALVIGVTGGIATGKSTVLGMLGDLGAETVSADDIAREVLAKGTPAYQEAIDRFGQEITAPTRDIDRAKLASVVFGDAAARQALNDITHPRIIARMQQIIDEFRSAASGPGAVLALEIPLLIECSLERMVDRLLVVAAEQETQVSRLTTSSEISREQALQRIGAQMPLELKIECADRVIWNDGTREELARSVQRVWEEFRLL
mgnify:FL=1